VDDLVVRLRTRLLPALLTAAGVAFLTAGLITYTAPVEAGPDPIETPTIVTLPPTAVVAALGIDLAVVRQPDPEYPACDVAMYHEALGQPGFGRATYLYAHAREGMFLPILTASQVNNGAAMLGMIVEVYTSDDQLYLYEITEVRRHQLDLDDAVAATTEEVWLQTSEGPKGTRPKTQVVARFLSTGPADHAAAHPEANPVAC
jgi:hypothetical protein